MFYEKLLATFYEELKNVQTNNRQVLTEANLGISLCAQTISKMKKAVLEHGFENRRSEIQFFKHIKVVPMQYLVYYTEVRSFELRMPKLGEEHQMKFLNKQITKTNSFFASNTELLIYMDEGYTHFDKLYFTRKYIHHAPSVTNYAYYQDPVFNTSRDGILARLQGFSLYIHYLKDKKQALEKGEGVNQQGVLNWTGSYAAFIEMIYGCDAMGYFNNGTVGINTIIEELGNFLNVPGGNSSRTYNEIKNRKHSRIKFYEETGQKLLDKMNREDGIR